MPMIRVPYPREPERRRQLFEAAVSRLARYGAFEGDTDSGSFWASTPIGGLAGSYHSPEGSDEIEIEIVKRPWLVSMSRIESEVRKFTTQV